MGTISGCRNLKVNMKAKIYLYVNSTTQRCPKEILKIFLLEDFFHLPPVSTTPVVHLELRISKSQKSRGIVPLTKFFKKYGIQKLCTVIPLDGSVVYSATLLWARMILRLSNPVEDNKNGGAVWVILYL
jgi:hypothetical protein